MPKRPRQRNKIIPACCRRAHHRKVSNRHGRHLARLFSRRPGLYYYRYPPRPYNLYPLPSIPSLCFHSLYPPYFIANATFQPLSGRLTAILGRRAGLVVSDIFFAAGNLICGLAQDKGTIIFRRVISGIGGGGLNRSFYIRRLRRSTSPETRPIARHRKRFLRDRSRSRRCSQRMD